MQGSKVSETRVREGPPSQSFCAGADMAKQICCWYWSIAGLQRKACDMASAGRLQNGQGQIQMKCAAIRVKAHCAASALVREALTSKQHPSQPVVSLSLSLSRSRTQKSVSHAVV